MKLADIKVIAGEKGVSAGKMTKLELIRAIQAQEGNPVCFASGRATDCNEGECLWRKDCN